MSDNDEKKNGFRWIENPDKIGEMLFTFDGEKIFIISNELDCLKKKVSDKNLPLD